MLSAELAKKGSDILKTIGIGRFVDFFERSAVLGNNNKFEKAILSRIYHKVFTYH